MPLLQFEFTDDELAPLRSAATRKSVPLEVFVHDAAVAVAAHRPTVAHCAEKVAELSAELNKRLE